jgi:tripeptide aminopeptidase
LIAAEALTELARLGWHGFIEKPAGQGTANAGIIRGGTGSNVVMAQLHILAEARSHDPRFRQAIVAAWREVFTAAAARHRNQRQEQGTVRFGPGPTYEAYALEADSPVLREAMAAAQRVGLNPRCESDYGGNDANWIVAHGIPTVTIGCGQHNIHMPTEEINLAEFSRACRLAVELATA